MKVLFLDIDGVLNRLVDSAHFEPSCVRLLNRIVSATNCKIVLSSTWRHWTIGQDGNPSDMTFRGFEFLMRTHGALRFSLIGTTVEDGDDENDTETRGQQIRKWLRANPAWSRYCVLDDCDDGISAERLVFVQTNGDLGLTEANADQVIAVLNGV